MRKLALGVAAIAAIASTPALAGTATGTVQVSLNVSAACSVTAEPLSFGTVSAFDTAIDASSPSTVKCTPNAAYTVYLDYGVNAGVGTQRKLKSTTSLATVNYNLYSDSTRLLPWGGTLAGVTGVGNGNDQAMTIYGQVPTQTAVAAGDYKDTVTVTVNY
jgi:spore coat protein U-like protein